ncbi:DNA cytosine methyltransferase [Pinibacter soli]|uniref:DNA (cytosine-5-)-methyltransferase n=1 Tax=Pinibacter soli TaxID=3044211 RepID=A0ABT6RBN3_9BACT|nr:DNA cytosine methyltransferase [Pinibacter soli]MDI3319977.1 DNA cytosine methyltransferase [Pinibacter soli]
MKTKKRKEADLSDIKIGPHNVDTVLTAITKEQDDPLYLIIDLFCGAGGTTTGFELARVMGRKIAKVIACVNHDPYAIKSHWANHPWVLHFSEDIRTLDMDPLIKIVQHYRKLYPNAKLILWASLECTNHSKAKGGMSRDADSRTLAEHLFRYVDAISPDHVQIENVVEFKDWGPLQEKVHMGKSGYQECPLEWKKEGKGKKAKVISINPVWVPVPELKGIYFNSWRERMNEHGYSDDWRELNSADFGAFTSRNRLFGIFAKDQDDIVWPKPTHARLPIAQDLFGEGLQKWRAVKEVLDFNDEGESIFNRKKGLCDKTLKVIHKGLIKSLNEGEETFLFKYYGNTESSNSVNEPAGTLTTKDRFAKVQIFRNYKTGFTTSVNDPVGVLLTVPKAYLLSYILNPSHGGHTTSVNNPCPVIVARQDKAPLYLIRAFMDENGIVDIKMRMLGVKELLKIQGFPDNYRLLGNQADQKKFIGNSVVPGVPKGWLEAMGARVLCSTSNDLQYSKAS